jgi:serine/threonine protein kinase
VEAVASLQSLTTYVNSHDWVGIVHNKINPDNIFLTEDRKILKLGGFDLLKPAKLSEQTGNKEDLAFATALLREKRTNYLSPEKLLALQTEIEFVHEDPCKADIFSVGATLLYMLMLEAPDDINK